MIIITGLGNPGEKFKHTRHNAGFMALDFFACLRRQAKKNEFPEFIFSKKYNSFISENTLNDNKIILLKPQTFMNESGTAVKKVITHYKLPTKNLVVVQDDIDLPLGKIKFSKDSGAGGHKGVDSIINNLGKKDFIRLKIGICPVMPEGTKKPKSVEKFVIQKFTPQEKEIINNIIEESTNALNYLIENGIEKTMNEFNNKK
ncbi:MAG: Peptidyl-tRNA hydrolase [Parcubacteria group bacterium GW2011_GWA2_33_14]|uniref:Peptidyl-tRNA hydrolase n=1 Tax=Candidatus Staskawiczbacteria bacterium RIFCSPHIGHO2_02_FULL_33_16 TaxID=1802204 RepID=A0A1G2HW39_9BACT|nr:MAG: Peptidyl-tRNA hydrolase [Parcubacteria group bacterium GW2011_GWA2_33_14]OGZ66048.1 MAG: aminoacyl-tRNA hydrolase [Candidatus Staskawiczbacteria bacterium RIFCSPHIGHO2_02_FULL_33_16]OGZ70799.1 MAG: aminoacyl-tRNA hydrolase [Candidatus Staskawiczbacteria bacterium RIFCSPLOWO2_01_FULL_33_13]